MKTIVAIAIFGACLFGMTSAIITVDANCNTKIQQYRDCGQKMRDQRESEAKAREDAEKSCFTSNGCTAPGQGQGGNDPDRQKREQCNKDVEVALKAQVQTCVQGKVSGLTFPNDGGKREEHRRGGGRGGADKMIQQACGSNAAAVPAVKACLQKARPQSTPDQERARFNDNCKAKAQCDAILNGGPCKAQLDQARTALCQCGQQVEGSKASIRTSTPSCAGLPAPQQRPGGQGGQQRSCDNSGKPDYCQLGFDKFQADRQANRQGGNGH